MKILPVSDIHLEFGTDVEQLVDILAPADVCIIAGDLTSARLLDQVREDIRPFSEKYDQVIYVPGNHEYYNGNVDEVDRVLAMAAQEFSNVHLLRPDVPLTYKGQRFIGGTMWFPDGPLNAMNARLLNDFRMIDGFVPWVYERNAAFRKMLKDELEPEVIVVTHHLPTPNSVPIRYRRDITNIFFVSPQGMDISYRQPKMWVHGHTHTPCDYRLGDTRVVCNPYGYPFEDKTQFNPKLIIEV